MAMISRPRRAPRRENNRMTARDKFREIVAETLTDWRLGCIPPRADSSFERAVFIAGLGEILALRLRVAYTPLLEGLQRIEDRVAILTTIRADPYAPKDDGRERIRVA